MLLTMPMHVPLGSQHVFPTVQGTASSSAVYSTSSISLNLPSSIQAGELLVVCLSRTATSNRTISAPSGWTILTNRAGSGGLSGLRMTTLYKTATGSEGATQTFTYSGTCTEIIGFSYRISEWASIHASEAQVTSTAALGDCPSLNPGVGVKKILWLPIASCSVQYNNFQNIAVSGYSNFLGQGSGNTTGGGAPNAGGFSALVSCRRFIEAASEDPGPYTYFGSAANYLSLVATIGIVGGTA